MVPKVRTPFLIFAFRKSLSTSSFRCFLADLLTGTGGVWNMFKTFDTRFTRFFCLGALRHRRSLNEQDTNKERQGKVERPFSFHGFLVLKVVP